MPLKGSKDSNGKLVQYLEIMYNGSKTFTKHTIAEDAETFKKRFSAMIPKGFFIFLDDTGKNVVINFANVNEMKNYTAAQQDKRKKKIVKLETKEDAVKTLEEEVSEETENETQNGLKDALEIHLDNETEE